jgi:hypothetical protein
MRLRSTSSQRLEAMNIILQIAAGESQFSVFDTVQFQK